MGLVGLGVGIRGEDVEGDGDSLGVRLGTRWVGEGTRIMPI